MSARTAAELVARRLQLVQPPVTPLQRHQAAVDYLHAMATAPALIRWWSWWRSAWDGVWPARVREALADALEGSTPPRVGRVLALIDAADRDGSDAVSTAALLHALAIHRSDPAVPEYRPDAPEGPLT